MKSGSRESFKYLVPRANREGVRCSVVSAKALNETW